MPLPQGKPTEPRNLDVEIPISASQSEHGERQVGFRPTSPPTIPRMSQHSVSVLYCFIFLRYLC